MIRFIKEIYFDKRFYALITALVLFFIVGYYYHLVFVISKLAFIFLIAFLIIDMLMLFRYRKGISASRETKQKFSNGDRNEVVIHLKNHYPFEVLTDIIDEIPEQFQKRDFLIKKRLKSGSSSNLRYFLRPVKRGEYQFGSLNIYAGSFIGLIKRRYRFSMDVTVPVYPSFLEMRKYELQVLTNKFPEVGIKRTRKIGRTMEFEKISRYVPGDDFRTINWKATARRNELMVNQYQDERSQYIYSVIDMGRTMKMPFNGMTLLDYAINASLVLSDIAVKNKDKAGLVTFSDRIDAVLKASSRIRQVQSIMELLYRQETAFMESDYRMLNSLLRRKLNRRSLVLLFTNFETFSGLERNLDVFRSIAKNHLLLIVFFENTELTDFLEKPADSVNEIYSKVIAEKLAFEKQKIVKELEKHGIHTMLSSPETLNINTINKYLEIKSRRLL